ncbi:MAG: hypothetical protein HY049_07335 [Acidobacteria bacterium]|nr:hypothetical protein [Acidobacteriota bacterium]
MIPFARATAWDAESLRRGVLPALGAAFLAVVLVASPAGAATIYVDDNTCPATGSGSLASPYCHIQDAICVGVSGDVVSVLPGTYPEAIRMRPNVSVISSGGAAVTTINSAGKPCTDSAFCTKRTGTQCSVVTFGSGHTPTTVLDGFTITGGGGQAVPSPNTVVGGGGIYVFSSPTIRNNIIENNVILNVSPSRREFDGAGIYVSFGAPVITNNVITGNRAVPAPGISTAVTYGYGGGVYSGFFSNPQIIANTIQSNWGGDPNIAFSVGGGGGVMIFPPDANNPGTPLVDRNLIADNIGDTYGGGVGVGSILNTVQQAVVSNNVIVGNTTYRGAGVYNYLNKSKIVNNTITGNTGQQGAGLFTGLSDVTLPTIISNNLITGNHLMIAGEGGGIYKQDNGTTPSTTLEANDVFGNQKNQVAGDITDATFFTTNGNFTLDPNYVNEPARDYHVNPNSPVIDRAFASRAPAVDKDNTARGFDGNGIPNNPQAGDNDVGAYEWRPPCVPQTEVCNGVDDNCNGLIDEGFPNTDGDALANCVDPDDDNDGVLDGSDCAPLDVTAFGNPAEITNVLASGSSPTTITYDVQNIGSGTHYEIVSGLLTRIQARGGFQEDFCVAQSTAGGTWQDSRPTPPLGNGWYYFIRDANNCGTGTYGSALRDSARSVSVCPTNIRDLDFDGSPSDLDCNDVDPNVSPFRAEVCDGLDNNCSGTVDEGNPGGGVLCGVSNVGDCRLGSTQCLSASVQCVGSVLPAAEICDGHDNNCNNQVDEGFPDTDSDGAKDCIDPDDDNDGTLDASDCAPLDATAFGVPVEIQDVSAFDGAPQQMTWTAQAIGSGTRYQVATGQITSGGSLSFPAGTCQPSVTTGQAPMNGTPALGVVFYYMVTPGNACGTATYGSAARNTHPACP